MYILKRSVLDRMKFGNLKKEQLVPSQRRSVVLVVLCEQAKASEEENQFGSRSWEKAVALPPGLVMDVSPRSLPRCRPHFLAGMEAFES